MKHKSVEPVLKRIAGFLVAMTGFTLAFAVAHLLMTRLYAYVGFNFGPLVKQVLNSLTGLCLLGLVGATLAHFLRASAWAEQMNMFAPLLRAMEQIARGDFSVRVENPPVRSPHEPLYQLFAGVNNMAQELKQMETMRQEFISNVSHEIQSPLTSIRGFAQALKDEALSPQERSHYLTIIETESMRLSKLSDNLLALAALEAENRCVTLQPYRLDKQIRRVILACEPQWLSKNLDLEVAVTEILITADEDLLNQVWVNLIHNSIKFTPDGGRICISLCPSNEHAEFRIADSGIGIVPADQARIFERFFKADKARNQALGGSGLGLSIAMKIVEMHKGTMRVESTVGAGATFIVMLPLA